MGAYTVPEEIRKMKTKGTTVKVVNGSYYVYTNTRHKDEARGKWKTDSGRLEGKIIRYVGFIPKGTQVEARKRHFLNMANISLHVLWSVTTLRD